MSDSNSQFKNVNDAVMYDKNGLPIYGMDAELALKQAAKYDPEKEAQVRDWIEQVVGEKLSMPDLEGSLKDGITLCKLANTLVPGAIQKVNNSKLAFMQMENINKFLDVVENYLGVKKTDSFRTVDLYEGKNIVAVIDTLFMVASAAQKLPNYSGPRIGVKIADKTEFNFSEDKLRAARAAPTALSEGGIKGDFKKSIGKEIIKTTNSGDKRIVPQLSEGGLKGDFKKSIGKEIIKVNSTGDKSVVAQQFQPASNKKDFQKSLHNEVVKTSVVTHKQPQPVAQPTDEVPQETPQEVPQEIPQEVPQDTPQEVPQDEQPQEQPQENTISVPQDVYEALEQLDQLRQQGLLEDAEFEEKRNELLAPYLS